MRLDPVYVLAPLPKPASIPTRRAFLMAGATFVVGSAAGGVVAAAARALPSPEAKHPAADSHDPKLETSGDFEIDLLRHLATRAPLDELFTYGPLLLARQSRLYQEDEVLWQGAVRMSDELHSNPGRAATWDLLVALIRNIETLSPPAPLGLDSKLPGLLARRDALAKPLHR